MGRVSNRKSRAPAKAGRRPRLLVAAVVVLLAISQTGCIAVGLTLLATGLGVGAGTATSYTLNGYAYRTFPAPLATVERATLKALKKMGIHFEGREATEQGALVHAAGNERSIQVRLEKVTPRTTRMRTVVRIKKVLMDRATATEIIIQTEEVLNSPSFAWR